jgi:hypothetical protein
MRDESKAHSYSSLITHYSLLITMHWLRRVVIILAFLQASWMTSDGLRAFIVGDYVIPKSGEYAGQLGPWAKLVSVVGVRPRSTLMKSTFVVYGVVWLAIILCYILNLPRAQWAMLLAAAGSLWYLWTGTVSSTIQIALLLLLKMQETSD